MPKPLLFEINTRVWLHKLRQSYSADLTLATIPDKELDSIALYFDWVWLMGVWDHSRLDEDFVETHPGLGMEAKAVLSDWSMDDIIGSPYSIKTYTIHPMLGSDADFRKLKQRFNERGVKVMVDFVPNHFGFQSPLIIDYPDYFLNTTKRPPADKSHLYFEAVTKKGPRWIMHGKDPHFGSWEDTAQVSIFNPDMRQFMISQLQHIASMADGVRCDMAMLVNNKIFEDSWGWFMQDRYVRPEEEFWQVATKEVKEQHPDFIFLAEVYWDMEWELLQLGFDYCYDKQLYDRLIQRDYQQINLHLGADLTYQSKMCRFIENHDEPRVLAEMTHAQSLAAAAMILTLPGLTLIHHGQMTGRVKKIPVQLLRQDREVVQKSLQRKYIRLLSYVRTQRPINSIWQYHEVLTASEMPPDSVFSWSWQSQENMALIVINYADYEVDGLIQINLEHKLFHNSTVELYDHVTADSYHWQVVDIRDGGLYVRLQPYQYHLFSVHSVEFT